MGIYKLIIACASYLPSIIGKILICLAMAVCTGIGFIHVMVYHKIPVISAPAYRSTFLYRTAILETKRHLVIAPAIFKHIVDTHTKLIKTAVDIQKKILVILLKPRAYNLDFLALFKPNYYLVSEFYDLCIFDIAISFLS